MRRNKVKQESLRLRILWVGCGSPAGLTWAPHVAGGSAGGQVAGPGWTSSSMKSFSLKEARQASSYNLRATPQEASALPHPNWRTHTYTSAFSPLLMSHWSNQIMWPSPASKLWGSHKGRDTAGRITEQTIYLSFPNERDRNVKEMKEQTLRIRSQELTQALWLVCVRSVASVTSDCVQPRDCMAARLL